MPRYDCLLILAALGIAITPGCEDDPAAAGHRSLPSPKPTAAPVAQSFLNGFFPKIATGMKWVYDWTAGSASKPVTIEIAIATVSGEVFTAVTRFPVLGPVQSTGSIHAPLTTGPFAPNPTARFTSFGAEAVTVPLAAYPSATKVEGVQTSSTRVYWLVQDIGVVKATAASAGTGGMQPGPETWELKTFSAK
jgi:hypothetical protein